MKKNRSAFLGILGLLVILVLAAGCYRPAAPDVTGTPAGDAEASPPGTPDVEATARANATEAAETTAAQTPEQEEPTEVPTEPPATATPPPTATTEPTTMSPTVAPTATTAPTTSGPTTYVVQADDNLFRIALRYGTTVEAIAEANGIANPRLIRVGQTLIIPEAGSQQPTTGGTTYVVQPGDNLFRIALRYDMSYRRVAEYNGITNPSNIYVGQVIQIPPQ